MAVPAIDLADQALESAAARAAAAERSVFAEVFALRVRMNVLEWAERRRYLSPEANALAAEAGEPVRYSTALTPYHRDILLACSDPATEIIVCMFPSQDGKTEIANNFIGQRIDLEPGPMLILQPTKEMAEAWSKDRLAPMLRDTPALRGRVRDARSRDADNTILHKKFPGGHLTAVGSNSAAGLASRPIRDVVVDEVDRCAKSAGTEGDSIRLAFRRATTFRRGKKLMISSPTIKGESRIDAEFRLGTQEVLEVPCPHCREYQVLEWGGQKVAHGLKWEKGKPDEPYYVCVHHGCVIEEREKAWMLERYRWTARNPSAGPRRRSFWKNALASLLVSWRKIVQEWHEVQGKPLELQQFFNTVLCELFDPIAGEEVKPEGLAARLGVGYPEDAKEMPGTLPAGVAKLTRSTDTQDDRLETSVWGWGEKEESWLIEWELIPGDPNTPGPWKELDEIHRRSYRHASGTILVPEVHFVDSGGHATDAVYKYTKARNGRNVFAIKGATLEGAPLLSRPTRNNSARAILYHVGSFSGKEVLIRRLTKIEDEGPGFVHLPLWLDGEQIAQFAREKLVWTIVKGGLRKRMWVKTGANEQIDLYVYALAALQKLGHHVNRRLGEIAKEMMDKAAARAEAEKAEDAKPDEPERPARSSFRDGRTRGGWGNRG